MVVRQVDLVFVVDASQSMGPLFNGLSRHLNSVLEPLQQQSFSVRLGLVAYASGVVSGLVVHDFRFICGSGGEVFKQLYESQISGDSFFSKDSSAFSSALATVKPHGNEDTLLALDVALDFPFGPTTNTRRVIALFSDEPIENGVEGNRPLTKLPEIIKKIQDRKVLLFAALPESKASDELAATDGSEVISVGNGGGLESVDLATMLTQMGKSISVSTIQGTGEVAWKRAIFGQDKWGSERFETEETRQIILAVGESATIDASKPFKKLNVRLKWTANVDLDLHAFCSLEGGSGENHVFFGNKNSSGFVRLDTDAGIGNRGGNNVENITITAFNNLQFVLFSTKIFSKGGCFADYDGQILITLDGGQDIVVPLTARQRGDWCVIALLNCIDQKKPRIVNINQVHETEPSVSEYGRR